MSQKIITCETTFYKALVLWMYFKSVVFFNTLWEQMQHQV